MTDGAAGARLHESPMRAELFRVSQLERHARAIVNLASALLQALFLPTTRAAKYKAKAAIDTFFFRIGDVIAGPES